MFIHVLLFIYLLLLIQLYIYKQSIKINYKLIPALYKQKHVLSVGGLSN